MYEFAPGVERVCVRLLYRRFWPEVASARGWMDNETVVIDLGQRLPAVIYQTTNPLEEGVTASLAGVAVAPGYLAAFWLLAQGRLPGLILAFALLDLTSGLCFVAADIANRRQAGALKHVKPLLSQP